MFHGKVGKRRYSARRTQTCLSEFESTEMYDFFSRTQQNIKDTWYHRKFEIATIILLRINYIWYYMLSIDVFKMKCNARENEMMILPMPKE